MVATALLALGGHGCKGDKDGHTDGRTDGGKGDKEGGKGDKEGGTDGGEEPPAEPPIVKPPLGKDGKPDYRHCQSTSECTPIECNCSCSGCGGISYDEMINAKYSRWWRQERRCRPSSKPGACPAVCCKAVMPVCQNGRCVARPKPKAN